MAEKPPLTIEQQVAALTERVATLEANAAKKEKAAAESIKAIVAKLVAEKTPVSSIGQAEAKAAPKVPDRSVEVSWTKNGKTRTGHFKLTVPALSVDGTDYVGDEALDNSEIMARLAAAGHPSVKEVFKED